MKYYKILRPDLTSFHDNSFKWDRSKIMRVPDAEPDGACGKGLHLAKSINDGFRYAKFPARVFEVEPKSKILGEDETKIRVSAARLGKEITPAYVLKVNEFLDELKAIPWFKPNGKPDKKWKLFDNRDAAGDAAWATARDAARAAAWAAAWATALFARMLICSGLKLNKKHRAHIKARMNVWRKGYGLLCGVNGTLYVYKEIK